MSNSSLTINEAKSVLGAVITTTEKSIEKLLTYQKEVADDSLTLKVINQSMADNDVLPDDCPYKSWTEWKEQIEKELKSSESSVKRIGVEKAELIAFKYFMDNATEE